MGILYREFKLTFSDKTLSFPFPAQNFSLFSECTSQTAANCLLWILSQSRDIKSP